MPANTEAAVSTADREVVVTRLIDAPRELVFDAFSRPEHVARWWGPLGFTLTTRAMDFRPGGVWEYVMHGPDGTDYPNRIAYLEIARPSRIHYDHGSSAEDPSNFRTTITFESEGAKTRVTLRAVFPSREARDYVVEHFNALQGGRENVGRLAVFVESGLADTREPSTVSDREIISTRVFSVSRDRLFKAWTDAEILAKWWGPKGFTNTFETFELRPGGDWRFVMHGPGGAAFPNHSVFREVVPSERIVFDHLSDHEFRVVATFTDEGEGARLTWEMQFATVEEYERVKRFAVEGNRQNLDRLEALLRSLV